MILHKKIEQNKAPLLRMRHLAVIMVVVGALAAGPLCVVWKQVYITEMSMRQSRLADSVAVLNKQAAQFRLSIDRLSNVGRIETLARDRLGLDYPSASQIIIVKKNTIGKDLPENGKGFFAVLRRSMTRGRG